MTASHYKKDCFWKTCNPAAFFFVMAVLYLYVYYQSFRYRNCNAEIFIITSYQGNFVEEQFI